MLTGARFPTRTPTGRGRGSTAPYHRTGAAYDKCSLRRGACRGPYPTKPPAERTGAGLPCGEPSSRAAIGRALWWLPERLHGTNANGGALPHTHPYGARQRKHSPLPSNGRGGREPGRPSRSPRLRVNRDIIRVKGWRGGLLLFPRPWRPPRPPLTSIMLHFLAMRTAVCRGCLSPSVIPSAKRPRPRGRSLWSRRAGARGGQAGAGASFRFGGWGLRRPQGRGAAEAGGRALPLFRARPPALFPPFCPPPLLPPSPPAVLRSTSPPPPPARRTYPPPALRARLRLRARPRGRGWLQSGRCLCAVSSPSLKVS